MTPLLQHRLRVFCAVIAALLLLVGWSAFTAWGELGVLRRRFTEAQFESFRIAGELESNTFALDTALLSFAATGDISDWTRFEQDSARLNVWIDSRREVAASPKERQLLGDIDTEYDRYLAVAESFRSIGRERPVSTADHVHRLETAAQRMFALAGRLAEVHRAALGDLLGTSQRSLKRLEVLLGAGFSLVIAISAWGMRIYFRETITPLRRQLIESLALAERHEKLASLGVLAAGVAHEIRNPLMAIKTRAYTLQRRLAADDEAAGDAVIIERETERLERVVRDFLLFARPGEPEFTAVGPDALLQEIRELLAPELSKCQVAIIVESDADIPAIRGDPQQLKQVLLNLIRNAAESIEHDGRITLRARRDRLPFAGRPQDVVVLEVEDTGMGISAEVQKRLFDPFFTTKPTGTGLGLSIAMGILKQHGGTMQFQTSPGRGTTFGVVLPLPLNEPAICATSMPVDRAVKA